MATAPLSLPDSQQQQVNVASANIPHVTPIDTSHHRPFTTFHRFSSLPTELRSAIWRLTFEPRILALCIQEKNSPYYPIRVNPPWTSPNQQDWEWDWAVSSSYTHPILLSVSHESRSVTLQSYVALNMCRQGSPLLGQVYVDYSRDAFYFSINYCNYMRQTLDDVPSFQIWEQPPIDPRLTKYIAISAGMVPTLLICGITSRQGDFTSRVVPMYTSAAKVIGSMCSRFTSLKAIWLVSSRRRGVVSEEVLPPGDFLLEPIIENEDQDFPWSDSDRLTYQEKISALVDAAKLEYPDLNIPNIGAKLRVNSSRSARA